MIYRLIFLLCLLVPTSTNAENVLLFRYLEQEIGEIPPYSNKALDCTSHAGAMAIDILAATQIHMHGQPELFKGRASPEMIHWGAREVFKQDTLPGISVKSVVHYLRDYGIVYRQEYSNGQDNIDLTDYDAKRAWYRANKGVPDWLQPELQEHMVLDIRQMRTAQDIVYEIKAGRPVLMGSNYAFPRKRDKDGFTVPYLSIRQRAGLFGFQWVNVRRKWSHAMVATGFIDGDRPGIVIQNSHGSKQYGPNPYDLPEGAFAVDLQYIDLMVKNWYDCWSIGDFVHREAIEIEIPELEPQVKFSGIVILSTPDCIYCKKQVEVIEGRPFRVAVVNTSKVMMDKLNLGIYPTTLIIENGQPIKKFSGFTPWAELEPHTKTIIHDKFEYRTYGSFDDMVTAGGLFIESFFDLLVENWNLFLKFIIDNLGLFAFALDSEE